MSLFPLSYNMTSSNSSMTNLSCWPDLNQDQAWQQDWPGCDVTPSLGWDNKLDLDLSRQLAAKLLMVSPDSEERDDEDLSSNPRFKTEICRNYKEKGSCLYGDLCQFAHGREELRMKDRHMNVSQDVVRHNKYKTKLCQKFWIAGYCAYGPRCNFIHNENERANLNKAGNMELHSYIPAPRQHEVPGYISAPRQHVPRIAAHAELVRKNSVGDSGDSGSEFCCRTSSLSPPGPVYGSGRMVQKDMYAKDDQYGKDDMYGVGRDAPKDDIFTWVDTWTQKYL
jgi:hypothetical protein